MPPPGGPATAVPGRAPRPAVPGASSRNRLPGQQPRSPGRGAGAISRTAPTGGTETGAKPKRTRSRKASVDRLMKLLEQHGNSTFSNSLWVGVDQKGKVFFHADSETMKMMASGTGSKVGGTFRKAVRTVLSAMNEHRQQQDAPPAETTQYQNVLEALDALSTETLRQAVKLAGWRTKGLSTITARTGAGGLPTQVRVAQGDTGIESLSDEWTLKRKKPASMSPRHCRAWVLSLLIERCGVGHFGTELAVLGVGEENETPAERTDADLSLEVHQWLHSWTTSAWWALIPPAEREALVEGVMYPRWIYTSSMHNSSAKKGPTPATIDVAGSWTSLG